LRNIPALSQVSIPVTYKNCELREPMRLDILVGRKVIIEVKATETVLAVHKAQEFPLRIKQRLEYIVEYLTQRRRDGETQRMEVK